MSNNLNLSQVSASQNQKEVTINLQAGEIDAAITVKANFAIDNTNARTLTATEFRRNMLFHLVNAGTPPDAAITLTVPAIARGLFAVMNETSFAVTVTISGQPVTAPVLSASSTNPILLTCDGVNVRLASGTSSGGAGDVTGPASAVNERVAVFDGTTGKLIKDGGKTLAEIGGTSLLTFNTTGRTANSSSTGSFDITGFLNRGITYSIKFTETGGTSTGTYDIKIFSKDTKLDADLLYHVTGIDSTADSRVFTDKVAVPLRDEDSSSELHLSIVNNDVAENMTFTIDIVAEKFA